MVRTVNHDHTLTQSALVWSCAEEIYWITQPAGRHGQTIDPILKGNALDSRYLTKKLKGRIYLRCTDITLIWLNLYRVGNYVKEPTTQDTWNCISFVLFASCTGKCLTCDPQSEQSIPQSIPLNRFRVLSRMRYTSNRLTNQPASDNALESWS